MIVTSAEKWNITGIEGMLRRVVSKDGKSMTVTLQRISPSVNNVEVYEKVSEENLR